MSVPKNCKGCIYRRRLSTTYEGSPLACHYLLDTGKRRLRKGRLCLSRCGEKNSGEKEMLD